LTSAIPNDENPFGAILVDNANRGHIDANGCDVLKLNIRRKFTSFMCSCK
jgi:hypothetical protein